MSITLKRPAHRFDHIIGTLEAPVVLVEYGDIESPHKVRALSVVDKLLAEFREDLCFVFRHYPNPDVYPNSVIAAAALEAAHAQGGFWRLFRHFIKHQDELSGPFIIESAVKLGMNQEQFMLDMEGEEVLFKIQEDIESGEDSGVEDGRPTFFLNGIMVDNPTTYDLLRDEIRSLLREEPMSFG